MLNAWFTRHRRLILKHSALLLLSGVVLAHSSPGVAARELCENLFAPEQWTMMERVQDNKFVTNRTLEEYIEEHPDLAPRLSTLGPHGHWIDLGAGKAIAQITYLKKFKNLNEAPLATAVAFKIDRWFRVPKFDSHLQVKEGAFELQKTEEWQKADVITDYMGVLAYSRDMHTSLQKTLDLLKVGGELYIYTTDFATTFRRAAGESFKINELLQSLPGLEVTGQWGRFKIIKRAEHVKVPKMEIIRYKDGAPPYRTFQLTEL